MQSINEKHLEFIQSVITRMNQNSSNIKTCYITILSAFFGIGKIGLIKDVTIIIFILILSLIFCIMDSYYLYLGRGFRHLYEIVANIKQDVKLKGDFDMTIPQEDRALKRFFGAFCSQTEIWFYLGVFAVLWGVLVLC